MLNKIRPNRDIDPINYQAIICLESMGMHAPTQPQIDAMEKIIIINRRSQKHLQLVR